MQNRQRTKRLTFSKNSSKLAKKIMKEGDSTEKLVESLVEELNCETVFTIPVFGGIAVDEGVVVTWIIMAVLTILSIVFVRNLSVEKPGKVQLMLESVIGWAQHRQDSYRLVHVLFSIKNRYRNHEI